MKGLFLHINSDIEKEASGEVRKARMQIAALEKAGLKIKEVCIDQSRPILKILRRVPFYPSNGFKINLLISSNDFSQYDFVYIRKNIIDVYILKLLKTIKRENVSIKILMEIPTYPYDLEWQRFIDKPILYKDKFSRQFLHNYVDKIVTFSDDRIIWGIPTIQISNGIDINQIKAKEILLDKPKEEIRLLAVALLASWHGYDRLIKGLHIYYKNSPKLQVKLEIVGEGPEYKHLQQLVESYDLNSVVTFWGKMHGTALDRLYNSSDLAIGSLGMHRIGLTKGYTLKIREYCARGLPFIKGYDDDLFDKKHFEFMLDFPADESSIDINKIVEFYNSLDHDQNEIDQIRKFAIDYLTWDIQMKPVVNYITN